MSLAREVQAIRMATGLSDGSHVACVRLSGEDAFEVLDRTCTSDLYLQDAQMRLSLLLSEDGTTLADVYVCRDDEDYLVLAEGLSRQSLVEIFRRRNARVEVRDLTEEHDILSLHGPYAWELLAELLGPDVVGLPYLSLFHTDGITCFRGGKTGEFGYDLLVPKAEVEHVRERILSVGTAFDLIPVSVDAVDLCSLENWFFNARKEGRAGLGPLELGLQWRVSYGKDYIGSTSLKAHRAAGAKQRATCAIGRHAVAAGQIVSTGGKEIGRVLRAEHSPMLGAWVITALLDKPYAYSGIDDYCVESGGDANASIPIRTVSPPVIDNRSLYVNPQKHTYATRAEHSFPPLV